MMEGAGERCGERRQWLGFGIRVMNAKWRGAGFHVAYFAPKVVRGTKKIQLKHTAAVLAT
jgi:hypothetical protein